MRWFVALKKQPARFVISNRTQVRIGDALYHWTLDAHVAGTDRGFAGAHDPDSRQNSFFCGVATFTAFQSRIPGISSAGRGHPLCMDEGAGRISQEDSRRLAEYRSAQCKFPELCGSHADAGV